MSDTDDSKWETLRTPPGPLDYSDWPEVASLSYLQSVGNSLAPEYWPVYDALAAKDRRQ